MFYGECRKPLVNGTKFCTKCSRPHPLLEPDTSSYADEVEFIGSNPTSIRPSLLSSRTSRSATMPTAEIRKAKKYATIANREKEKKKSTLGYRVDPWGKKDHCFGIDLYIIQDGSYTKVRVGNQV